MSYVRLSDTGSMTFDPDFTRRQAGILKESTKGESTVSHAGGGGPVGGTDQGTVPDTPGQPQSAAQLEARDVPGDCGW